MREGRVQLRGAAYFLGQGRERNARAEKGGGKECTKKYGQTGRSQGGISSGEPTRCPIEGKRGCIGVVSKRNHNLEEPSKPARIKSRICIMEEESREVLQVTSQSGAKFERV